MKKITICIAAFLLSTPLFALDMPFFTGFGGFSADYSSNTESEDYDPALSAGAFFSAQLDFQGKFITRGSFYVQSNNLFSNGILDEIEEENAYFKLDELSITYKRNGFHNTQFISMFLGNFEPIGSDIFLQRQFGIQPISSTITDNIHGLNGAPVYPFFGTGLSYVYKPESPWAIGAYAYINTQQDDYLEEKVDSPQKVINADLRYSSVLSNFAFDCTAGLGFPLDNSDSTGDSVILIVREIQLHMGLNMLAGNRYTTSFFLQTGFNNMILNPSTTTNGEKEKEKGLNFEDLYFLMEPRFALQNCQIHFGIFNFPVKIAESMIYLKKSLENNKNDPTKQIKNIIGANLCVKTDNLYIGNTNFTFGIQNSLFIADPEFSAQETIDSPTKILDWDRKLYITPFTSMPALGGTLNGALTISCLDLGDNWKNSFNVIFGFKTSF